MTREEAEAELLAYKYAYRDYPLHKWSSKEHEQAYNLCKGTILDADYRNKWNELVDSYLETYQVVTSPLYKLMQELNEDT